MYRMRPSLYTLVGSCGVNVFRHYRRYARRPVRVHSPVMKDESLTFTNITFNDQFKNNTLSNNKVNGKDGRQQPESSQSTGSTPQEDSSHYQVHTTLAHNSQHETNNLVNEVQFEHLKDAKDFVRSLLNNISSRKFREENKFFVGEGYRIIKEALDAGVMPEAIYFSRHHHLALLKPGSPNFGLEELNALNELPLYKTPYKRLQTLSSLTTCPGVFKRPEFGSSQHVSQSVPVTVILDEVREPGNLGGILRTLASVGVDQVVLIKGCCDPWESKVLRAACGAHFRIKLTVKATWSVIHNYVPEYAPLLLADVCRKIDLDGCVNENIQVLNSPKVKPVTKNSTSLFIEEDAVNVYEINSEGKKVVTDPSYDDEEHLSHFENVQLPVHYYDDIQILQKISNISPQVVIIIGGETGISKAARKFACFNGGLQVAVPLANGMDSLNTSVAVGIILYEIQRQFRRLRLRDRRSLSSETSL
ncbi:rRNA methyltransferase 3-like [Homarus americanus]|uniref:rRNA methyltransferase 3-like n=1 Tax=Homarus americanus TaxID=6706 RepID=A0A8J5J2L4_HOMAM|nr:rRNA methyltransferase 3-like [Homarus americanus]